VLAGEPVFLTRSLYFFYVSKTSTRTPLKGGEAFVFIMPLDWKYQTVTQEDIVRDDEQESAGGTQDTWYTGKIF
jgi:hypothetical protein